MRKIYILTSLLLTSPLMALSKYPDATKVEIYKAFSSKDVIKNQKRSIASEIGPKESDISSDMKKFRKELAEIKSADQLSKFLEKVERELPNYSNDMKVVGTSFLMLKPFRGIDYKIKPLLKGISESKRRIHLIIGNGFKAIDLFLPETQWDAIAEFLIIPEKKNSNVFSSVGELQNFILNDVYPILNKSIENFKAVYDVTKSDDVYVFDNQISYGEASFQDGLFRYQGFGKAEIAFMMFSIYESIHRLSFFLSYNFEDAHLAMDSLKYNKFLIGLQQFNFFEAAYGHVKTIQKHKKLFTLRDEKFSREMMRKAHFSLVQSAYSLNNVWREIEKRESDSKFMINGEAVRAYREKNDLAVENLIAFVESTNFHPIKSQITGEVVWINLYELFYNPPHDLKIFLPTKLNKRKQNLKTSDGLIYEDYSVGKAIDWNYGEISKYFRTSINGMDSMDQFKRVISGSQGGEFIVRLPFK